MERDGTKTGALIEFEERLGGMSNDVALTGA